MKNVRAITAIFVLGSIFFVAYTLVVLIEKYNKTDTLIENFDPNILPFIFSILIVQFVVAYYIYANFVSIKRNDFAKLWAQFDDESVSYAVATLRWRAQNVRNAGYVALFFAVGSIVFALYLIVNTIQISDRLKPILDEEENIIAFHSDATSALKEVDDLLAEIKADEISAESAPFLNSHVRKYKNLRRDNKNYFRNEYFDSIIDDSRGFFNDRIWLTSPTIEIENLNLFTRYDSSTLLFSKVFWSQPESEMTYSRTYNLYLRTRDVVFEENIEKSKLEEKNKQIRVPLLSNILKSRLISLIENQSRLIRRAEILDDTDTILNELHVVTAIRIYRMYRLQIASAMGKAQERLTHLGDRKNLYDPNRSFLSRDVVQPIITRFGAIIVVMFLAQSLILLYRYSQRMSAFYLSRSDLVYLSEIGVLREKIDHAIFAPDQYDFGKPTASPSGQAVELAKAIIDRAK